jgi:hypothetical protein
MPVQLNLAHLTFTPMLLNYPLFYKVSKQCKGVVYEGNYDAKYFFVLLPIMGTENSKHLVMELNLVAQMKQKLCTQ